MSKPSLSFPWVPGLLFIVMLSLLFGLVVLLRADTPHRILLSPPATNLTCANELSAIRESMFQSSMGEAILARRMGDNENFTWFFSRARLVQTTDDLKPSPATCMVGNRKTLRVMAASWEYQYLLDQVIIEKRERQ